MFSLVSGPSSSLALSSLRPHPLLGASTGDGNGDRETREEERDERASKFWPLSRSLSLSLSHMSLYLVSFSSAHLSSCAACCVICCSPPVSVWRPCGQKECALSPRCPPSSLCRHSHLSESIFSSYLSELPLSFSSSPSFSHFLFLFVATFELPLFFCS